MKNPILIISLAVVLAQEDYPMKNRWVEWNVGEGTRTSSPARAGGRREDRVLAEVRVHFSNDLDADENLRQVLVILRDSFEVEMEQVVDAVNLAFNVELSDVI